MKKLLIGLCAMFVVWIVDALLGCIFVMLLWNALLPELFAFPRLTLLQSIGVSLLCRILFTSNSKVRLKS